MLPLAWTATKGKPAPGKLYCPVKSSALSPGSQIAGSSQPCFQIVVSVPGDQPLGNDEMSEELLPQTVASIPSSGNGPWSTATKTNTVFTGPLKLTTLGVAPLCSQWWSSEFSAWAGDSMVPEKLRPHRLAG